jgi:hypothetical protein
MRDAAVKRACSQRWREAEEVVRAGLADVGTSFTARTRKEWLLCEELQRRGRVIWEGGRTFTRIA